MSFLSSGPSAKSYRPFCTGLSSLSNACGLVNSLTLSLWISFAVKYSKLSPDREHFALQKHEYKILLVKKAKVAFKFKHLKNKLYNLSNFSAFKFVYMSQIIQILNKSYNKNTVNFLKSNERKKIQIDKDEGRLKLKISNKDDNEKRYEK
ncbi:hypothetical protein BpHYR1_009479 [Brachionus plicatilis]|uniref:Uncharacterized protein n=1 Tax=Brachionus plicatilis TaxID=10195 RepID=A0A3M7RZZ9_BRAPC|nr:hypothetical protein BpHYR1_009479 [Brachionus plicatilis]